MWKFVALNFPADEMAGSANFCGRFGQNLAIARHNSYLRIRPVGGL
jgi:hypothetical protein